jgi:hypothetical protein
MYEKYGTLLDVKKSMWGMNLLLFPLTYFSCEVPRGDTSVLKRLFCLSIYCMIPSLNLNLLQTISKFKSIKRHGGGEQFLS